MKMNINPKKVFDKLSKEIAGMREGIESGNLSKEEVTEFREDLQDVILEAFKTKFAVRLDILYSTR